MQSFSLSLQTPISLPMSTTHDEEKEEDDAGCKAPDIPEDPIEALAIKVDTLGSMMNNMFGCLHEWHSSDYHSKIQFNELYKTITKKDPEHIRITTEDRKTKMGQEIKLDNYRHKMEALTNRAHFEHCVEHIPFYAYHPPPSIKSGKYEPVEMYEEDHDKYSGIPFHSQINKEHVQSELESLLPTFEVLIANLIKIRDDPIKLDELDGKSSKKWKHLSDYFENLEITFSGIAEKYRKLGTHYKNLYFYENKMIYKKSKDSDLSKETGDDEKKADET